MRLPFSPVSELERAACADNRTASKWLEPLEWFEAWLRKTGREVPSDRRLPS